MRKLGRSDGSSLRLDYYKNNSNYMKKKERKKGFDRCPNASYYVEFVKHGVNGLGDELVRGYCGCKSWDCPACAEREAWKLRKKTVNAVTEYLDQIRTDGFRDKYHCKFLTLTFPGRDVRDRMGIDVADVYMKKQLNKLMTALKKRFGKFEYMWVVEPQGDGYPHFHLLLMGDAVVPMEIYGVIKALWELKYGMGFSKIRAVSGGIESIAYYMSKYLIKGLRSGKKHNRVYSMSRYLRSLFRLDEVLITILEYGRIKYCADGSMQFQAIWRAVDDAYELPDFVPKWVYETVEEDCQMKLPLKF